MHDPEVAKLHARFGYHWWLCVFVRVSFAADDKKLPKQKRRLRIDVSAFTENLPIKGRKHSCVCIDLTQDNETFDRAIKALVRNLVQLDQSRMYLVNARGKIVKKCRLEQLN